MKILIITTLISVILITLYLLSRKFFSEEERIKSFFRIYRHVKRRFPLIEERDALAIVAEAHVLPGTGKMLRQTRIGGKRFLEGVFGSNLPDIDRLIEHFIKSEFSSKYPLTIDLDKLWANKGKNPLDSELKEMIKLQHKKFLESINPATVIYEKQFKSHADIVNLVWESGRMMPAHFTSYGNKSQSFCIDYDFNADDEYNMASSAWHEAYEYANTYGKLTGTKILVLLKCGEDIMAGAYIATKSGKEEWIDQVVAGLVFMNIQGWKDHPEIGADPLFKTECAQNYFKFCREYASESAKKRMRNFL